MIQLIFFNSYFFLSKLSPKYFIKFDNCIDIFIVSFIMFSRSSFSPHFSLLLISIKFLASPQLPFATLKI